MIALRGKTRYVSATICLSLCLLLPVPSGLAHVASSTRLYAKAKSCQNQLYRSGKAMRYRDRWERCIELFQKFLVGSGQGRLREKASYHQAELYNGLAKYSGRAADLRRAEKKTLAFKQEYPRSALIESLERRLSDAGGRLIAQKQAPVRARLQNIRFWSYHDYTRVVFDLSHDVRYYESRDSTQGKLLIDLNETRLARDLDRNPVKIDDGILRHVRAVQITSNKVRAMVGLKQAGDYRVLQLSNPDRVVIDVFGENARQINKAPAQTAPRIGPIRRIMIDPGHGGKDPGAISRKGLAEKDVVLDVSLRLKELISQRLGKQVLMTRDRDIFIPLEKRTDLANKNQADLFLSVHANAAPDRRARGVEIYTLGRASDPAALATAARENAIHSDALNHLDGAIKLMLADLSVTKRLDESLEFAHATRRAFSDNLGKTYKVRDLGVKQAPFYVLMNAGMPGILAEIAFISNSTEAKRLATRSYREKIAESLYEGVRRYIIKYDRQAKAQGRQAGR